MTTDDKAGKLAWDHVSIPKTNVTVYEALFQRRMVWKWKDTPVPRAAMERMLSTAIWAPNHRMTEPWRFFVMEKDSPLRQKIAELAYQGLLTESGNPERAESYRRRVLDPPVVAYVYSVPGQDEFASRENYAAVCCALQNVALAGVAEGLSVTWETGRVTRVPGLRERFGAEEDWEMVTMLSIGYPDEGSVSSRTGVEHFVTWG